MKGLSELQPFLPCVGANPASPPCREPGLFPARLSPVPIPQPKAAGPCPRRGCRVPLVLPAAPMRSCDNRGHQRPLLVRALPCPGSRGCSRCLRTKGSSRSGTAARPGMLLGALSKHGRAGDGGCREGSHPGGHRQHLGILTLSLLPGGARPCHLHPDRSHRNVEFEVNVQ